MIRALLTFLGLSTSAAAQGLVPMAPVVDSCGGLRLILQADAPTTPADLEAAADVVTARIGGVYGHVFDYADVADTQVVVSLPAGLPGGAAGLAPLLERVEFGFHRVSARIESGQAHDVGPDHQILADAVYSDAAYVVEQAPILTGVAVAAASAALDHNNAPAVFFSFSDEGAEVFGRYTSDHVGDPFAIVLREQVLSAPVIREPIWGGQGMITGAFSMAEAEELAAILQGGVLPFDLAIVDEIRVDGSDPSADFCP